MKDEICIRSFPDVEIVGLSKVSTSGGDIPPRSPDGKELSHRNGDSFMAVAVEIDPMFTPGKPKVLFKGMYFSWGAPFGSYSLGHQPGRQVPGGEAGTAKSVGGVGPRKISIVLNWLEELKQRGPVK